MSRRFVLCVPFFDNIIGWEGIRWWRCCVCWLGFGLVDGCGFGFLVFGLLPGCWGAGFGDLDWFVLAGFVWLMDRFL